ncbi:ABC transporter substrate-binding protein [Vibrio sp. RE88]|uniref:substrate-binding periplasmic protein n=1 Tax=Vibrio sp. RE88 TaxID=2607610 RepID=UPI001493A1DB|nr:ABC transporter substrate-binding protein [Vibrio sp. RE88]NOH60964.1 ABC transporter substrate-binding protein [Vibrio sp. RE88]
MKLQWIPLIAGLAWFFSAISWAEKEINYYVIANQAQPFQIEEHGEKHSGIVTDIVKEIFNDSEAYTLHYHTYPFKRMISILEAGGEPNWITYGSPNWGNVQSENLSEQPIYTVKHALVTSEKVSFKFEDMSSLANKGVVLLLGFDYPELTPYIEQGSVEEIRVNDYSAAFRVLNKLPGDTAFVEMESRVKYYLNHLSYEQDAFHIQAFSQVIPDYSIYLAFSSQMDEDVQAYINARLKELRQSGKLDEIIKTYI